MNDVNDEPFRKKDQKNWGRGGGEKRRVFSFNFLCKHDRDGNGRLPAVFFCIVLFIFSIRMTGCPLGTVREEMTGIKYRIRSVFRKAARPWGYSTSYLSLSVPRVAPCKK